MQKTSEKRVFLRVFRLFFSFSKKNYFFLKITKYGFFKLLVFLIKKYNNFFRFVFIRFLPLFLFNFYIIHFNPLNSNIIHTVIFAAVL